MSEAEKKVLLTWTEYLAKAMTVHQYYPAVSDGLHSIEAYRAGLRREIEKRIPESPDTFDEYVIGTRAAMKTILELLDTVEP